MNSKAAKKNPDRFTPGISAWKRLLKSFAHAFNGFRILLQEERNARIHAVVAACVVTACVIFRISLYEWIAVLIAIGLVFSLEIINTAIENIADFVSPERNEMIKRIKDLSAAGVLVSAIIASIIGLIVFVPKILAWL